MARVRKAYLLSKRSKVFYYRLPHEKTFHSTGQTVKTRAEQFVQDIIQKNKSVLDKTLKEYMQPFFVLDICPHIKRLKDERKSIGTRYIRNSRRTMEKYIFPDSISHKKIVDIRRGDILDFRSRLLRKEIGENTVNKVIGLLKIIFKEALYREDIDRDPTAGIGNIKFAKRKVGIFTKEELQDIFPRNNLGPWKSKLAYTCFFLVATTGLRRGEVLCLKWKYINFDEKYLLVAEAWKDKDETGLPKWNHKRIVPLTDIIIEKLKDLRDSSIRILPDDLVFCYEDGSRLGGTWWAKNFQSAMKKIGIDTKERGLRPHSLRHTINTILRDSGEDLAKIRASLGWLSEGIQDDYTHFQIEHLRNQARIIDDIWKE